MIGVSEKAIPVSVAAEAIVKRNAFGEALGGAG